MSGECDVISVCSDPVFNCFLVKNSYSFFVVFFTMKSFVGILSKGWIFLNRSDESHDEIRSGTVWREKSEVMLFHWYKLGFLM